MTARSPRSLTAEMIRPTARSTTAADSRLAASRRAKARSNPGRRASSLSGTSQLLGRDAEALDPAPDLLGPRLERRAVDDEARGDLGDALDLDQSVRPQGCA